MIKATFRACNIAQQTEKLAASLIFLVVSTDNHLLTENRDSWELSLASVCTSWHTCSTHYGTQICTLDKQNWRNMQKKSNYTGYKNVSKTCLLSPRWNGNLSSAKKKTAHQNQHKYLLKILSI